MKSRMIKIIGLGGLLFAAHAQAVSVSPSTDAAALVAALAGSGITIVGGSESLIGATTQQGTFSDGISSGLGFNSGIMLTSGAVEHAVGPNDQDSESVSTGTGGNAALSALVGGATTNDQNVLTFAFQFGDGSIGGDLFFNYIFASEEYNEYVNSQYNDVFALFVDGVNIAIAPNGDPVSVNNVNCGNPFSGSGPNCASFNNNDPNDPAATYNFGYDGFTDAFTAQALGLSAGVHTMTFAIADTSDSSYDSAVFIQAGTFSTDPTPVPAPAALALLALGLAGLGIRRKAI